MRACRAILAMVVITAAAAVSGDARQAAAPAGQPPLSQAQQRPVFRGGTHFVRVDAYPVEDGKIVEGLTPADFEVLEDGKPQTIESFDFVKFDTFTPEAERRDPSTQREGFDLAADPRYRVFVIFVDMAYSKETGAVSTINDLDRIQSPLVGFLDRVLGPQDLFGFLTSRNSVKDLVLARKTAVTRSQIMDLWRSSLQDRDDADTLDGCSCGNASRSIDECRNLIDTLKARHRADATYTALTELIGQLGAIREERKNVIFVSNLLPRWRPDDSALRARGPTLPAAGISGGRVGVGDRQTGSNDAFCAAEFQRLANTDFDERYHRLLIDARQQNVTFDVITPAGLQAPVGLANTRAVQHATADLQSLASETDGIAVVNTNDLSGGMKKIADDLAAYYVLGYYTTNTAFDGGVRTIKVRYKTNGKAIRARRQYRAPTQAEIAALAAAPPPSASGGAGAAGPSPRESALIVLDRASRPFAGYVAAAGKKLTVVAELSAASIQAGRWKEGADVEVASVNAAGDIVGSARGRLEPGAFSVAIPLAVQGEWPARVTIRLRGTADAVDDWVKLTPPSAKLLGEPLAYRSGSRIAVRPVAGFEFARNERIRVEWPVLAALDRREVRLLDRTGKPLPVELPLSEDQAHGVVVDMSLSGLPRGDYLIELTAGGGGATEKSLLAVRIK